MIISFSGNDGSGKTTIAKELYHFFSMLGLNIFYKHEYDYTFLKYVLKIIGKKNLKKSRKEMLGNKNSLKYQFWPLLVWCDVLSQYIYFKIFKRKTIIFLDRYPYDHFMSFEYLGTLNFLTRWLYVNFPRPDISILLWVEPRIAYERKKTTHTYEVYFYETQLKRYLKLAKHLKMYEINTNEEISKTKNRLLKIFFSNQHFFKEFIRKCSQNRILFSVIEEKNLQKLDNRFQEIFDDYNFKKTKYFKDLEIINKELKNEDWILIDWRDYPWLPNHDIDILVKNLNQNFKKKVNNLKTSYYIDFQDRILGGKMEKKCLDITWGNTKNINIKDMQIKISEYNSLIVLLKILKNSFITIDNLIYLKNLRNELYIKNIDKSLKNLLDYINNINIPSTIFPHFLPLKLIFNSYREMHITKIYFTKLLFYSILTRTIYTFIGKIPFHGEK